ncbi:LysR family transcriptional regulator [Xanthobacter sp. KR7-225]|uniref:LysR family transcriptional regulator n=1 Tax=Xanthobacter sp. KR7-225 TaxID=3156613 RepID=UPI0032B5181E
MSGEIPFDHAREAQDPRPVGDAALVPPLSDVDLKLLAVFVTVVRCGGFALAQNALNVSPSTISIHISNLEIRVGAKLCKRGRSGFQLTPEGAEVFEAAKSLFAHIEEYRARIAGINGLLLGEINVGVIDNMVEHPSFRLDAAIAAFKRSARDVKVNVTVAPPNNLEQMILDGQLHMAISFFPRRLTRFLYEPMFSAQMDLCCGRDHPLFDVDDAEITPEHVTAAEHAQRGYVTLEQMQPLHRRFRFTASSPSIEGLAYLILSGSYLGFLSSVYARRWIERGQMRVIRPDLFSYRSDYFLAYNKTAPETRAFRLMLQYLRAEAHAP